jgi:hypothetical protein
MDNKGNASIASGLVFLLQVILITLKAAGVITWPWPVVLLPWFISIAGVLVVLAILIPAFIWTMRKL